MDIRRMMLMESGVWQVGEHAWIVLGVMEVFYSCVILWMHKWTTVKIQTVYLKKNLCASMYINFIA